MDFAFLFDAIFVALQTWITGGVLDWLAGLLGGLV